MANRKRVTAPPSPPPTPEEIKERAAIERENSLKEMLTRRNGYIIEQPRGVHVYSLRLPNR